MVPDKFNMVDMGGIDLIMMQGESVPGLHDKLMAAISSCRYQCLYNWLFDGILIPPTYVQLEDIDGEVFLNEGVSVTSDDVIHIYSLAPGPVDPEIIPLLAEENGVYNVPSGKDGFNPVTVDVPSYTPVIDPITITENGTYTASTGKDGFSPVVVNVSSAPSKYLLQTPIHQDFVGGYVSSGTWNVNDTTARTDIYQVYGEKHYIIHLGSTVGNRFRCAFFTTDPALATSTLTGVNISNIDRPLQYDLAISTTYAMFSPSTDGFVAVGKTNAAVNGIKSYLVDFEESN